MAGEWVMVICIAGSKKLYGDATTGKKSALPWTGIIQPRGIYMYIMRYINTPAAAVGGKSNSV